MSHELIIQGKTFRNAGEAGDYFGVARSTVAKAKSQGTLDTLGKGRNKPIFYKGQQYYSQTEAAEAHGVTRQAISIHVKRELAKLKSTNNYY